jgi:GNAT superfamily N-acetyltransferase
MPERTSTVLLPHWDRRQRNHSDVERPSRKNLVVVNELVVRRATTFDALFARDIRCLALHESPMAYGTRLDEVVTRPLRYWRNVIRHRPWFLAFDGGTVVGMATTDTYDFNGETYPGVYGMYVAPSHRGTRVASSLLEVIKNFNRSLGHHRIFLDVVVGNDRAEGFYRREGFQRIGDERPLERDPRRRLTPMVCDL